MKKVLVLEDDVKIRGLIVHTLREMGLEYVEAGTLEEARELIKEEIGALVLDLRLPNGHGFELLRSMASSRNDVPTVVVSAFPEDRRKGAALPIVGWIEKPFAIEELRAGIRSAIKASESIDGIRKSTERLGRLIDSSSLEGGNPT